MSARLCNSCEEPIPAKRLVAKPNARLCVVCQQNVEANESKVEEPVAYFKLNQIIWISGSTFLNEDSNE